MLDNYGIRTDLALEATERFTEENVEFRKIIHIRDPKVPFLPVLLHRAVLL